MKTGLLIMKYGGYAPILNFKNTLYYHRYLFLKFVSNYTSIYVLRWLYFFVDNFELDLMS
jgi:hypothetical protein